MRLVDQFKIVIFVFLFLLLLPRNLATIRGDSFGFTNNFEVDLDLYEQPATQLADKYFDSLKRSGFNGALLVGHKGKIIYKNVHGLADFAKKDSLNENSLFELASVSKQFTAAAIMFLHQQQKLQYRDTVQQYITDFPYPGVTIRHLLTHRSGLNEYHYYNEDSLCSFQPLSNQGLIDYMVKHKPMRYYPPDRHFNYSNTNYAVLAAIVEKISGKTFGTFLQESFFEPLGMNNTLVFNPDSVYDDKSMTIGHTFGNRKYPSNFLDKIQGDKGIYSTITDMFIWDQALLRNQILWRSVIDEAIEGKAVQKHYTRNYGFGWRVITQPNRVKVTYHAGWWHGYNTLFVRVPEKEITLIILANKRTRGFFNSYKHFLHQLDDELFPPLPKIYHGKIVKDTDENQHVEMTDSTELEAEIDFDELPESADSVKVIQTDSLRLKQE